jgi:hypothetical protein
MAGYADCIAAIQKAADNTLTEDDIDRIVTTIQRRRKQAGTSSVADEATLMAQIAKEIADEERLAALVEQRSQAINVIRKQARFDWYAKFQGDEARAISILNVGSEKAGEKYGLSVAAQQRALEGKLTGPMLAELRAAGVEKILKSPNKDFEQQVARNMWAITEAEVNKTSPVLSGMKEAQDTAKILTKYQEIARVMQNDSGAWIGQVPGYIVRQSHDMWRIRKAGYESWRDTILPKLDERVFDGVDDREAHLKRIWTGLSTGEHYRERGSEDWLVGFKGPGNLAKRASQERSLHFKSADDWYAYNEQFGSNSMLEAVIFGLRKAAGNTALMRTWGTNPEAAFTADLSQLLQNAGRKGDAKQTDRLKGWLLKSEMDQVTGAANIPGNVSAAQIGGGVRSVLGMAKLGFATLGSIPDIAVRASALRHQGVGLLEGYGNGLKDFVRGRGNVEERAIADHIGVGMDGFLGGVMSRFSATDNVPGRLAKLQNRFFRYNLLSWWTDGKATGAGLIMAHNLARNVSKGFDGLDEGLRVSLTRYGITAKEWDVLRKVDLKAVGDTPYLTPDMVQLLPDEAIRPLAKSESPAALRRAREDLEIGLRSFYSEEVATAVTMGGARERAIASWGTKPGTPVGEAVRFIMQFKLYPITYATRHISREINRGGVPGVAHLILATTAMGYLSQSAKEIAKGREPRDPSDWKTWAAAMQQGGGLGIYGDFLFGEYNRFGGGALETLMGPGVGTASDILRAFGEFKDGFADGKPVEGAKKTGAALFRVGVNNVPFVNLFYTKAALDYLVLYQISEALSPGYLRRMERRLEKENGQKFILPPSSAIPYGGGNRLLEGVR